MHLLVTQSGTLDDSGEPRDLGQSPGDVVVISAADTELALLAGANDDLIKAGEKPPSLRLVNFLQLKHNYSVDLYVDKTLACAKLVIVRLLGGAGYWRYGLERLKEEAAQGAFSLVVLPGDDKPDATLEAQSNVPDAVRRLIWDYLNEGGRDNAVQFLRAAKAFLSGSELPPPARPVLKAGIYGRPPSGERPIAGVIFYRALTQSGDLAGVDGLISTLNASGLDTCAIFVSSLRDPFSVEAVRSAFRRFKPDVILNTTAFASSGASSDGAAGGPLAAFDVPVLQVVLSSASEASWQEGTYGLSARDIAMHVALPEVDGRILTRPVAFKADAEFDAATEHYVVRSLPRMDRARFVAAQAAALVKLRKTERKDRRLAIVLANYPNRDGRLANGVGLDTPASAVHALNVLADGGYAIDDIPQDGNALIEHLQDGVTNAGICGREIRDTLRLEEYDQYFSELPDEVRGQVTARWGDPSSDPKFVSGAGFAIAAARYGAAIVAIQPARGYNIDPKVTYHDPALVPPHSYLAFYFWLRHVVGVHAVVHLGKHGNLEWLPGKSLALSENCFPEVALGPLPNVYPFIVNDPGEGSQAKRRSSAVIIDHMTPPMTRAELYDELLQLEVMVDEYYQASGLDEKRCSYLRGEILATSARLGLDKDCGLDAAAPEDIALQEIDNHLCELKEMQIRDGLHTLGRSPEGTPRRDLLVAMARIPRCEGVGGDASLLRALSQDLGFSPFDPLDCDLGEVWSGSCPPSLDGIVEGAWRTAGDTVERLEALAAGLIEGGFAPEPTWARTQAVLDWIQSDLAPRVDASGSEELEGLMRALDGRFVSPGPSGAPTRGRPDVLPTGRNFFSLDSRSLPTPAAWELGRKSAERVIARYTDEHGDWPKAIALSAWGTSNMRTGGDDIAQALALLGVKPVWEGISGRVNGFETISVAKLGRPRVDVTFRMSGFFRDAFPAQVMLIDSAVRMVAGLDEDANDNPIATRVQSEGCALQAKGLSEADAFRLASARVFGSQPGAYGAGLQALIDEGIWQDENDLADAYLTWGQYAYGQGLEGEARREQFETRMAGIDAILHNQDNREHDILDSDDYYQFEGGLAVAAKAIKGAKVQVYHNDHSRPERPVVRTLEEEIGRVVRGRAANPKWISGVMRHGYKGAFEMAATLDYLFSFAATTGAVQNHHFDALYDAYFGSDDVRSFIESNNLAALREMAARFQEAIDRGFWVPRRNSVIDSLEVLNT